MVTPKDPAWCGIGPGVLSIYCERIVPRVAQYMVHNPQLLFMQDNTPSQSARATRQLMQDLGIWVIGWPPYSPDMNPIEFVWC